MVYELEIAGYDINAMAEKWRETYRDYVKDGLEYHTGEGVTESDIADDCTKKTWDYMRREFGAFGFDVLTEQAIIDIQNATLKNT